MDNVITHGMKDLLGAVVLPDEEKAQRDQQDQNQKRRGGPGDERRDGKVRRLHRPAPRDLRLIFILVPKEFTPGLIHAPHEGRNVPGPEQEQHDQKDQNAVGAGEIGEKSNTHKPIGIRL